MVAVVSVDVLVELVVVDVVSDVVTSVVADVVADVVCTRLVEDGLTVTMMVVVAMLFAGQRLPRS